MRILLFLALLPTALFLSGETLKLENSQWRLPEGAHIEKGVISVESPEPVSICFAEYRLPVENLRGRICALRGEFRTEKLAKKDRKSQGGRINLRQICGEKRTWFPLALPAGTASWTAFQLSGDIASDAEKLSVQCGLQNASGKTEFRDMTLSILGTPVSLNDAANMGWIDRIPFDGKGGWYDAGPEDDGRYLERVIKRELLFNGYPFRVGTGDKSVLVMKHPKHFPNGPESVTLRLPSPEKAKYLYLLHTSTWMGPTSGNIAEINVCYDSGKEQKIVLRGRRDLVDWSHCVSVENAKIAVSAKSGSKPNVALYASCFPLYSNAGRVTSIQLKSLPEGPVWIIAGITLSDLDFVRETPSYKITPGKVWKVLERNEHNTRIVGSALDLTRFRDNSPCGTYGRVIVTPDGHFAFENQPGKKIRFFTNTIAIGYLRNHASIDVYVDELCKNGFNMLRIHYLDLNLVRKMKEPGRFDPIVLDCFEYLVARCKEKGIYLNLDCMTNAYGYDPGEPSGKRRISHKSRIYFEPEIRKQWSESVRRLLTKVNPYTKTRLVDDPVLAMIIGYNEQEFGFLRTAPASALPAWREFLKKRYKTIDALRAAWGEKAGKIESFDSIPIFSAGPQTLEQDGDLAAFALEKERECMRFYRAELDAIGYKGPLSGYNMLGNKHYLMLRKDFDYVSKNSYEMLMTMYSRSGSILDQSGSISNFSKMLRNSLGARVRGKPFFVTEYGIPFWNHRRYEMPYTLGAYAAFQDFDGIAAFGDSYAFRTVKQIRPVRIYTDPISVAGEYLSFFLFLRGDVSTAKTGITIRCHEEKITGKDGDRGGPRLEEGLFGLMTKVDWEVVSGNRAEKYDHPVIEAAKGTASLVSALHSSSTESAFGKDRNPAAVLRKLAVIGGKNRSDGLSVFETDNREILLDGMRSFMRINTPRFQGICGNAGMSFALSDFRIKGMSANGNMSLVSIDGTKPIREAERLILVYATNALNSGMEFDSPEMRMLNKIGGSPSVFESAQFTVEIRSKNADALKLYPLDLQGKRMKTILPTSRKEKLVEFSIDTANEGASPFFEISTK